MGGPIANNEDIKLKLIAELDKIVLNKVIYTEFRNFTDCSNQLTRMKALNYNYIDRMNYLVPTNSLEKVKSNLSKSKIRLIK